MDQTILSIKEGSLLIEVINFLRSSFNKEEKQRVKWAETLKLLKDEKEKKITNFISRLPLGIFNFAFKNKIKNNRDRKPEI